jgi:hypothetical protein
MWYLAIVLLCSTAIFAGLWLDTRVANTTLQELHARSSVEAAWQIISLRYDNSQLSKACDQWAKFDRAQVRKIADQAREIHDLHNELDQLRVAHAKVVLGGVEISAEQQAAIDSRVNDLAVCTIKQPLDCHQVDQ